FPSASNAGNSPISSDQSFSAFTVYVSTNVACSSPSTERNNSTSIDSGRSAVSFVSFQSFVIVIDLSSERVFVMSNSSISTAYPATSCSVTVYSYSSSSLAYFVKPVNVYVHSPSSFASISTSSSITVSFCFKLTLIESGRSDSSSSFQVLFTVMSVNSITPASQVGSIPSVAFTV